jgi:hypothetical protein
LPVTTIATAIRIGLATAKTRTSRLRLVRYRMIPTSRFQPRCRLGMAAYLLTRSGGWSQR